ncbi:MAG: ABC transporter permease, partial [Gemmatimonadota bacterium]|nr:ABC transporter permease [Gemmatimonadota bacterium]
VTSVAFITMQDFAQSRGDAQSVSFVLATVTPGQSPDVVARQIERAVPGVTAQSRQAFAAQERKIISDMVTDLLKIMDTVGFLIGLAVVAVTTYIATFARRAEFGVLKAVGARNGYLYRIVLLQALYCVLLGFAGGVAFTLLLAEIAPQLAAGVTLQVSNTSLLRVGVLSLVIAGIASILPIWQLARIDPATVFRGGTGK